MEKEEKQEFTLGGILAVIGLIAFSQGQFQAALFLLGIGVVFMGRSSEEFRREFTNFIFSIFKFLWKIISGLKSRFFGDKFKLSWYATDKFKFLSKTQPEKMGS